MAHIDPLSRDSLPEFEGHFALVENMMGFVPNSMFTMARVPGLLDAFSRLGGVVLANDLIPNGLKQLIALMVSTSGGCRYCQAHTGHTAERGGVPTEKLEAIWSFETSEHYDDAERAALRVARAAGQVPNETTAAHFDDLKLHFTDDQCAAIVAVCSFFGYLNRWNDTMATNLEDSPSSFGERVLADKGWEPGKHASV